MIYLFYGSDVEKTRAKAFEWVSKARAKEPNLAYIRLAPSEITAASLQDAAESGGLFVKRLLVLLDDPFENNESAAALEEHLNLLSASDNAIIIVAPKLPAIAAKKISGKSEKSYVFEALRNGEEARGFNAALVNALQARNREKLWVEINRALRFGDAPEALHGLLHWKARDLMQKGSRTWTPEESRALSLRLISLLQESRRGGLELSESLERFALSV